MLKLFEPRFDEGKLHPIFKMAMTPVNGPERQVLEKWAEGFEDRDGKFVDEFQLTFQTAMWELYLHAVLKEYGFTIDMTFDAPDFVVTGPTAMGVEATVALPAEGGAQAFGYDPLAAIPENMAKLNHESALRLCNSISAKHKKYQTRYSTLPQSKDVPFVIAVTSFDRPFSHMAVNRSIMAALYGYLVDESDIFEDDGRLHVGSDSVSAAIKSNGSKVPMGMFLDKAYEDVSAVIFSPVATWGKVRALAKNPDVPALFRTFHPRERNIIPEMRVHKPGEYEEHLLDGLYVFHNPFAKRPLAPEVFRHQRVAQFRLKDTGEFDVECPDDFLMLRQVQVILFTEDNDATLA
jgi:hypothetical protein